MNKLLIVVCVIIIIILLDLIFNISKRENFQDVDINKAKSIVSKMDGTIVNFNAIEKINDKTTKINIPIDNNGKYLDLDNELNFSNNNDGNWSIHNISNNTDLNLLLKGNNKGYDIKITKYPFYMVTYKDTSKALQYTNGKLLVSNIGNYDSQKWDLSDEHIPHMQVVLKNVYDTPIGLMPKSTQVEDPNRIKLIIVYYFIVRIFIITIFIKTVIL